HGPRTTDHGPRTTEHGLRTTDDGPRTSMLFRGLRHIHFVGIGGVGMSGIAEVLLSLGQNFRVTGSDLKRSHMTEHLESMGAIIHEGHRSDNMGIADVGVTSSAVRRHDLEVVAPRPKQ